MKCGRFISVGFRWVVQQLVGRSSWSLKLFSGLSFPRQSCTVIHVITMCSTNDRPSNWLLVSSATAYTLWNVGISWLGQSKGLKTFFQPSNPMGKNQPWFPGYVPYNCETFEFTVASANCSLRRWNFSPEKYPLGSWAILELWRISRIIKFFLFCFPANSSDVWNIGFVGDLIDMTVNSQCEQTQYSQTTKEIIVNAFAMARPSRVVLLGRFEWCQLVSLMFCLVFLHIFPMNSALKFLKECLIINSL